VGENERSGRLESGEERLRGGEEGGRHWGEMRNRSGKKTWNSHHSDKPHMKRSSYGTHKRHHDSIHTGLWSDASLGAPGRKNLRFPNKNVSLRT